MDFDSMQEDQPAAPPAQAPDSQSQSTQDFDSMTDDSEKYGTLGQQAIAGLEGVGQGLIGPVAPLVERSMGVDPQGILNRASAHPVTSAVGQGFGLVGGALTGTGEAALMTELGEGAAKAAGFGAESLGAKIGSSIVKNAAEMAVLQGSDEVSKMVLSDPDTSAQTALANVGLAAALGGAGGAFMTGAVSPLWEATAGPKVNELLNMVKNHVNGGGKLVLSAEKEAALKTLGIEADPVLRAGISDDAKAQDFFSDLRRSEKPEVLDSIDTLRKNASDSVMQSAGVTADEVANYDENEAGHGLLDTFKREYNEKYSPVADALQKRDTEAATIPLTEDSRYDKYNKILEDGMSKVGTDSPYYKEYDNYGNRLLAKETIGDVDKLKTEIYNRIKGMNGPGTDFNLKNALQDIKSSLSDFQESQISRTGRQIQAPELASDLLNQRAEANRSYAEFAKMSDDLTSHLGVGEFRGAGSLQSKLTDQVTPEQLLRKFSIKNNSDFTPFLQKNFPDTLEHVLANERKQVMRPAVLAANKKGEVPIDINKLHDIISKGMAGKSGYMRTILNPDMVSKVEAAKTLVNAIPSPRDSGTPAGIMKIFKSLPTSALAAVGWLTGHGPIASLLFGETANRMAVDAPQAYKLAYLKFMASDQPIEAKGFKSMVDMFDNTYKGAKLLNTAASNVFKSGASVLSSSQVPSAIELQKLDKLVSKNQDHPNELLNAQNGSVGHYLPNHQTALTQASTQAQTYLQALKPQPKSPNPLDKAIQPTPQQEARYNRALEIAQQPSIVLQKVKDGTLQASDIKDINGMYPALYKQMTQKLSNEMTSANSREEVIPYKTRVGISLFLGQPMDSSMTPNAIMAAQPAPKPQQSPQPQGKNKRSTSNLGKSNKSYQTTTQSAESDRSDRE